MRAAIGETLQAKRGKKVLTLLDDCDQSLFQSVGLQRRSSQPWPVLVNFYPLPFPYLTSYLYTYNVLTCKYKPRTFSIFLPSISLECLVPFPHSMAINILRFTSESPTLLLIPPNQ